MTLPKRITRKWATDRAACPKMMARFFKIWPNGLTVNRKNLVLAGEKMPLSTLNFVWWKVHEGGDLLSLCKDRGLRDVFHYPASSWGLAKRHAYANTIADSLGLR